MTTRGLDNLLHPAWVRSPYCFAGMRVALVALMCWLAAATALDMMPVGRERPVPTTAQVETQRPGGSRSSPPSAAQYMAKLNYRRLFGEVKAQPSASALPAEDSENIAALLADIEIQGTVLGRVPKVIVFNRKTKETSILGIGDKIGQIEIIVIERDQVRFRLFDEEHDVRVK